MKVTLVGAGPGDIGLLTLKGKERIQSAEVVLYDRFVSSEILDLIPEDAEKIDVGKQAGNHPVPQETINSLLLEKARQGFNVVRLKGGDPFVFGRGGEEVKILAENGIPFEVVPGVSSAIAGAAYAGIPVTHRECASSLHILTTHSQNNKIPVIPYKELVKLNGTLVFMMSSLSIEEICEGLISAGTDAGTPAAVIQNATLNTQRKLLGTVKSLPLIAKENAIESPAIIVIGEVCRFSEDCDWFGKKPLLGKRVLAARSKPGLPELSDGLRELGCVVFEAPCPRIVPITGGLEKKLKNINDYSWLVFTSGTGVNIFFDYLITAGFDIRNLYHLKVACVGAETEKEINKYGIKTEYRPDEYNSSALACGLVNLVGKGERLLIARAEDGAEDLTNILSSAGISFDDIPIYKKIKDAKGSVASFGIVSENSFDIAVFTSSSAVESFAESMANTGLSKIKAVCIGEKTAAAAKSFGMTVFVSKEATIESMIEKIKEVIL
jgi:uroporphyrinogen III methyltransferase/synthase